MRYHQYQKGLEINGFEDFAVMWGIEEVDSLADEVSTCWNEVLILCDSMAALRNCQDALKEEL